MNHPAIPTTQNKGHGFWNAMGEHASEAWPLAVEAIACATGESLDAARAFLDSAEGRHFADDVHNATIDGVDLTMAISAAITRWASLRLSRATAMRLRIPLWITTSYLDAMVIACDLAARDE